MPPARRLRGVARDVMAARKLKQSSKDKEKGKKRHRDHSGGKENGAREADADDDEEWAIDHTLEECLETEAKNLEQQLADAGKVVKEKKKTKKEAAREAAALTKSAIEMRQAEQGAKHTMFAVDGKVKDKRDMLGKGGGGGGGGEAVLFEFEASGTR